MPHFIKIPPRVNKCYEKKYYLHYCTNNVLWDQNKNPIKAYRVLSCVLYYFIENYVCIDYLCCHSKTLSVISSYKVFEQASYNILLGIIIIEVLMNLVSCHGFMEKPNSTVILNVRYCLVNKYLAKGLFIIKNDSKHLISLPNDLKLIIHAIDQLETYFSMKKNTATSAANTIKNCIFRLICIWFTNKTSINIKKEIYDPFIEYLVPVMDNIDHPVFIEEWKQTLMLLPMKKKKTNM